MSLNLDTSQLSELENYQPPMKKKLQILEKSKKGHERCVDRFHRKIVQDKLANDEAKKQELQEKARKLKEWNQLMETVKSYQIPLISSITINEEDDVVLPLSPTKKLSANYKLSTLEKETLQKAKDEKKEELLKLATLEAKERCTIRKRYYEGKIPFETFNNLLKFQNERRNAFNEGRLKILTLEEEFSKYEERLEKTKELPSLEKSVLEEQSPQSLEVSSGSIGSVRGNMTPKVSLIKKRTDITVQYIDKEELVSTQEIRKLVLRACKNVIDYQEDLHRKRVRAHLSKVMDQIVKLVIFNCETRQAVHKYVSGIIDSVVRNQNEIARRKERAKFIAEEVDRVVRKVIHFNETKQEIERLVSSSINRVIETQAEKENREFIEKKVKMIIEAVIHHQETKQIIGNTAWIICQNVEHIQATRHHIKKVVQEVFDNVVLHQNNVFLMNESECIVGRVINNQETKHCITQVSSDIINKVIENQNSVMDETKKVEFISNEVSLILERVIFFQTTKKAIEAAVGSILQNVIRTQSTNHEIKDVAREIIQNVIRNQDSFEEEQRVNSCKSKDVDSTISNVKCITSQIIPTTNTNIEVETLVSEIIESVVSKQSEKQNKVIIASEVDRIIQNVINSQISKKEFIPDESKQNSTEAKSIIQQEVEIIIRNVIENHSSYISDDENENVISQEVEKIIQNVITRNQ